MTAKIIKKNFLCKERVLIWVFLYVLQKKTCIELYYAKGSGVHTNTYTTHSYIVSVTILIRGLKIIKIKSKYQKIQFNLRCFKELFERFLASLNTDR